jgi:hypothetical protein
VNNLKYTTPCFLLPVPLAFTRAKGSSFPVLLHRQKLQEQKSSCSLLLPVLLHRQKLQEQKAEQKGATVALSSKARGSNKFNPYFLTGFCDAESCFSLNINKNPFYKLG